jgi:hypothetical protein
MRWIKCGSIERIYFSGLSATNMSLICYEFTIFVVTNMSLICAADALNLCGHYVSGMGSGQLNAWRTVFERMTDLDTAVIREKEK